MKGCGVGGFIAWERYKSFRIMDGPAAAMPLRPVLFGMPLGRPDHPPYSAHGT